MLSIADCRQTRCMTRSAAFPNAVELMLMLEDDKEQNDEQQREDEGKVYYSLDETKHIKVADDYVTFTLSFK